MKALDTSALLALLEGDPRVRGLLRRWRGEEIATSEANLLELACLAHAGPARGRSDRLAALGRLRRRLTVLPIDARAMELAASHLEKGTPPLSPCALGMLAALRASGCEELVSDDPGLPAAKWGFKLSKIPSTQPKKRQ